jgi:hypothetical protein
MMNIDLHIDRLVLEGLPIGAAQGPLVQAAVEAELSRLLTEQGPAARLQSGGALPSLRASPVRLVPGSTPAQVGVQIARSVYGGMGGTK